MKLLSAFVNITIVTLLLTSCSAQTSSSNFASNIIQGQQIIKTTKQNYPAKTPQTVALYPVDKVPKKAYKVIGVASVSKYNLFGVQREQITLNKMMKQLAASIGGDGLINLNTTDKGMEAKVIAYQRILL